MQLMLRADVPHDYVLATGISHRLSFFLAKAFAAAGIDDWTPHVVSPRGAPGQATPTSSSATAERPTSSWGGGTRSTSTRWPA